MRRIHGSAYIAFHGVNIALCSFGEKLNFVTCDLSRQLEKMFFGVQ